MKKSVGSVARQTRVMVSNAWEMGSAPGMEKEEGVCLSTVEELQLV